MSAETIIAPSKPKLKQPPHYKVMFIDDDISTMQCVVNVLEKFFNKNEDDAFELMMQIHFIGNAIVGIYPKDIAETKISLAKKELKEQGYPLQIELIKVI